MIMAEIFLMNLEIWSHQAQMSNFMTCPANYLKQLVSTTIFLQIFRLDMWKQCLLDLSKKELQ